MRPRHALVVVLLASSGCFLASGGPTAPPAGVPGTEQRMASGDGDVDVVADLAGEMMSQGRVEEARDLLVAARASDSEDPAMPLLLAVAEERLGDLGAATDGYRRYADGHFGLLARRARERLAVRAPDMLRIRLRALADEPLSGLPPITPGRVAVVPLSRTVDTGDAGAEATAVAALVASSMSRLGWEVVDPMQVRLLLDEMGSTGASRAELAVGVELGRRLGAEHVVQGVARRVALDTVEWEVTVTSLRRPPEVRVDAILLTGGTRDAALLQERLAVAVSQGLEGRGRSSSSDGVVATLNPDALVAFGAGLQAMDRGDWATALRDLTEAVDLDEQFAEAASFLGWASIAARAPPLDSLADEIASVAPLQRAVRDARGAPGVGGSDRPVVSDLLGLDALTGAVLLGVTLTFPGGGR